MLSTQVSITMSPIAWLILNNAHQSFGHHFEQLLQILVVIEPLLIDEDYYARVEGREIISNLAKAAGLATMISTMRPDIDNMDEYVRNTTARSVHPPILIGQPPSVWDGS